MNKEKLTDEQIIKMLECCIVDDCATCPIDCFECHIDGTIIYKKALNLINRLKEENAELKAENERLKKLCTKYKIDCDNLAMKNERLINRCEDLQLGKCNLECDIAKIKGKETAEKFYNLVKEKIEQIEKFYFDNGKIGYNGLTVKELNELAKQFGVEIKE